MLAYIEGSTWLIPQMPYPFQDWSWFLEDFLKSFQLFTFDINVFRFKGI